MLDETLFLAFYSQDVVAIPLCFINAVFFFWAHEVWREEEGVGCAQPGEQSWEKQQLISAFSSLESQKNGNGSYRNARDKIFSEEKGENNRWRVKKKTEMATMEIFPGHERVIETRAALSWSVYGFGAAWSPGLLCSPCFSWALTGTFAEISTLKCSMLDLLTHWDNFWACEMWIRQGNLISVNSRDFWQYYGKKEIRTKNWNVMVHQQSRSSFWYFTHQSFGQLVKKA